jgi:hypothetical protein
MKKVLSGSLKQSAQRTTVNADEDECFLSHPNTEARQQRESLSKEVYDSDEEKESGGAGPQCAQQ